MKRSIFVVSVIVLLVLSVIGTTALASQTKNEKEYKLQIIHEDKYVVDEKIKEDSNVIIEHNEEVLDNFNITDNKVINIEEKLELANNKIISYWNVEEKEDSQYIISPVATEKNELDVSFITTNGGKIKDEKLLPSLVKTVEKETKLSDILPDIETEENFHFEGWFTLEDVEEKTEIKEEDREDLKELKAELEKKEKQVSKEKDKKKKKELETEVDELKKELESKKEEKQYDTEVINQYQLVDDIENVKLSKDVEYIAVLYPDTNNNGVDDRKEKINISVDFGLENEVQEQEIHVGQPIKLSEPYHENYIFIDWFLDNEFKERVGEKRTFDKDTSIYAQWKTADEIIAEGSENLISEERISDRIEEHINNKNKKIKQQEQEKLKEKKEKQKKKSADELAQATENQYTFKNYNTNQTFLIKFYDKEEFLFSVALPYGRTLEILDDNEQKIKEYGIRQESSIDLNEFINNSENIEFDIRTIKKNNAVITKIYPKNNKEMN